MADNQIEIPTFDDDDSTPSFGFGAFGASTSNSIFPASSPLVHSRSDSAGSNSGTTFAFSTNNAPNFGVVARFPGSTLPANDNNQERDLRTKRPAFPQQPSWMASQSRVPQTTAQHLPHISTTVSGSFAENTFTPTNGSAQNESQNSAPLELALCVILDQFIEQADLKISSVLGQPIDRNVYIPSLLAEGVDSDFDKTFDSIRHLSRRLPRLVVDMIMRWRKAQSDNNDSAEIQRSVASAPNPTVAKNIADTLNDRKSYASIYLLCRALSAVVESTQREALGEELGSKLEDIIFNSLKNATPSQLARSPSRQANMDMYARLIGHLSRIRFLSVGDRFIKELKEADRTINYIKDGEAKIEYLIRGMRFMNLQSYPLEAFEDATEFMESLAGLYDMFKTPKLKIAFAETLVQLLRPIIKSASAEVNHPVWDKCITTIYSRALMVAPKAKLMPELLPLISSTLSASSTDFLLANWQPSIDNCLIRVKEKQDRASRLNGFDCVIQLCWALLHRHPELPTAAEKRFDPVIKAFLPTGCNTPTPSDLPLDRVALIPHFVLYKYFDYGCDIIIEMLHPVVTVSEPSSRSPLDMLAPARMTVAINALLWTLDCFEKGQEPALPDDIFALPSSQISTASPTPSAFGRNKLSENILAKQGLRTLLESCSGLMGKIASTIDKLWDQSSVLDDRNILPAQPSQPIDRDFYCIRRAGGFSVIYPRDRQPVYDLLRHCFNAWPRCLPTNFASDFRPYDILCHGILHIDSDVADAASAALERLVQQLDGYIALKAVTNLVLRPDLLYREYTPNLPAALSKLESVIALWAKLTMAWKDSILAIPTSSMSSSMLQAAGHGKKPGLGFSYESAATSTASKLDYAVCWSTLYEVEAAAMSMLTSSLRTIPASAFQILQSTYKVGEHLRELDPDNVPNLTQVFPVLSADHAWFEDIDEELLSAVEKSRLRKWEKTPGEKVIESVATSDNPADWQFWQLIAPKMFRICLQESPMPTKMLRATLSNRVNRLQQLVANTAGLNPAKPPSQRQLQSTSEMAYLSDLWRANLLVLASITAAPSPSDRDLPGLAERFILPAELVRLALPFLATESSMFRDPVIQSLGHMHGTSYRALLDGLNTIVRHLAEERRSRLESRTTQRRSQRHTRLHVAIAQIFELSVHRLNEDRNDSDETLLSSILQYIKETYLVFKEPEAHDDQSLHSMRRAFCKTVQVFLDAVPSPETLRKWMSAEVRHDLIDLFDSWSFRPISAPSSTEMGRQRSGGNEGPPVPPKRRTPSSVSAPATHEPVLPAIVAYKAMIDKNGMYIKKDRNEKVPGKDASDVLKWLQALLETSSAKCHTLARQALDSLLTNHRDTSTLVEAAVTQCFAESDAMVLEQTVFNSISRLILHDANYPFMPSTVLCLSLWKICQIDITVRERALDIALLKMDDTDRHALVEEITPQLHNSFSGMVFVAQQRISSILAEQHTNNARAVCFELAMRILQLGSRQCRGIISILPHWAAKIELVQAGSDVTKSAPPDPVLVNLFLLTAKYGEAYHAEIRKLWDTLASASTVNRDCIIRFLVGESSRRGSKEFLRHAQKVIGCLAMSGHEHAIMEQFLEMIQPSTMMPLHDTESASPTSPAFARKTNLDAVFPITSRKIQLSPAQVAAFLSSDIVITQILTPSVSLLRILHTLITQIDHVTTFIRTQARETMHKVLCMVQKHFNAAHGDEELEIVVERKYWDHDDNGSADDLLHAPDNMVELLDRLLVGIEYGQSEDLRHAWSVLAIEWATTCPIRHVACRSFQMSRILSNNLTSEYLSDILYRLATTAADDALEVQVFACEALRTLVAAALAIADCSLETYALAYWTAMCLIESPNEIEVSTALSIIDGLLDHEHAQDRTDQLLDALLATRPFTHQKPEHIVNLLVTRGLRSNITNDKVWKLLHRCSTSSVWNSTVAFVPASIYILYAASLPTCLETFDSKSVSADFGNFCLWLATCADQNSQHNISRLMVSVAKSKFRTRDDFIRQAISNISEYYSSSERAEMLVILLGQLLHPSSSIRKSVLALLKIFVRTVEINESDLQALGPDVVTPLLRLLTTDLVTATLDVLDEAALLVKTVSSQTPVRSATVQNRRRAYTNGTVDVPELHVVFGEESESGWCVPDRATAQQNTRSSLREIIHNCLPQVGRAEVQSPFEFAEEEYSLAQETVQNDAKTQSEVGEPASLGDMLSTLHDLGTFFDDDRRKSFSPAAYRMSQVLSGSATRVAAVLARSVRSNASKSRKQPNSPLSMSTHGRPSAEYFDEWEEDVENEKAVSRSMMMSHSNHSNASSSGILGRDSDSVSLHSLQDNAKGSRSRFFRRQ